MHTRTYLFACIISYPIVILTYCVKTLTYRNIIFVTERQLNVSLSGVYISEYMIVYQQQQPIRVNRY